MRLNHIVILTILGILHTTTIFASEELPPITAQNNNQYQYVLINDPEVISVANFAVQQIQRGSLSRIISAQKLEGVNVTYSLVLDLVDAHMRHHHYTVEVLIPSDGSAWEVLSFRPVNY